MRLPKRLKAKDRDYLPKPQPRSIQLDVVKAADLRRFSPRFFCDDCSHYDSRPATDERGGSCTLGYLARHTRAEQMRLYELTGKMALCRAIEID